MNGLSKFGLLLWKNYIIQKRHKWRTVTEIFCPLFCALLLVGLRALAVLEEFPAQHYPRFLANDSNETAAQGGKYILYTPDSPAVQKLMNEVKDRFFSKATSGPANKISDYEFIPYPNEGSLVTSYKANGTFDHRLTQPGIDPEGNKNPVLAAVVFNSYGDEVDDIKYVIRFPASLHSSGKFSGDDGWLTERLYSRQAVPGPREPVPEYVIGTHDIRVLIRGGKPGYWQEGFLYFQNAIENSIARLKARSVNDVDKYDVYLSRYPYPSYVEDGSVNIIQDTLPLFTMLSFLSPVVDITKSIVYEKERRLKEAMKMMGLQNWLHWSAWIAKSIIILGISISFMTFLYTFEFSKGKAVLTYSSWSLLFTFLLAYVWSVITFGFLISAMCSDANSSATAAGLIFFVTYMPSVVLKSLYGTLSRTTKLGWSLISNTGMALGCKIMANFEGTGAGIQWSTIAQSSSPDENMSMLDIIMILIFDGIIYFLITLYVEAVVPGEYGVPLPWYFPFTKRYWCDTTRVGDATVGPSSIDFHHERNAHLFEQEPSGRAGIQITGLTKRFKNKVAVNDLHLNFYENQVTALLGHNGAGKTTTMSMLTGLFPPTSGTALVNGFDIRTDMKLVRGSLGLCPQHDVLFDELTVEEHLTFFCLLKGLDSSLVKKEVRRMLRSLMLGDKRHAQSQTLSGGMKRKLSVGIALVGGSQVVLLDEPTSGMDPGARRSTWDLITNEKKGRTIVLSTHFMDEADLLGDRIAIMAEGQVQCCGSSLFLKKKYGGGYHLIIVKQPNCQIDQVTQVLQQRMPEVTVDQNIGAELSYSLSDENSGLFPEIFEELERRKDELGIASYGCAITQMEEVFMRVGKQMEEEMKRGKAGGNDSVKMTTEEPLQTYSEFSPFLQDYEKCTGFKLVSRQLRAMFVKKCLYSIRHKLLIFVQIVIPVLLVLLLMMALTTQPDEKTPTERELDLKEYGQMNKPVVVIQCGEEGSGFCAKYQKSVPTKGGKTRLSSNFRKTILDESKADLPKVNLEYIVGVVANSTGDTEITGFFNNQPYHAIPVALNLISNAILREVSGNDAFTISMSNYPLPFSRSEDVGNTESSFSGGREMAGNLVFGMSFLTASFVVFIIKERETKSKHLQYVSGVKFPIFWLAHFLFDVVNYLIPCVAVMAVVIAFKSGDFKTVEMQAYFAIVLVMHGVGVIPLMYLVSFRFKVPSSGYVSMFLINVVGGQIALFSNIAISDTPPENLYKIAIVFEWLCMLLPNFDLGFSIYQLSENLQLHMICPRFPLTRLCPTQLNHPCCMKYPYDYLSWHAPGIGRHMTFLFLIGTVSFIVLFVIESKIIEKVRYGNEASQYQSGQYQVDPMAIEDSDVYAENARIRNAYVDELFQTDKMILRDLTKYYSNFLAVDRLCLGVQEGECFGLLGVNGAGKTTTFKMLTGDISITLGDAFIDTKSVKTDIKEVQRVLGYCPQFDAIIPELTGRETIRLFARLRGVPEDRIDRLVDTLGANLLFSEHLEKPCGTYSGGNKRKLSTSLALVGNPPMIFLDEPTTGMDPVARRHLWNTISQAREHGTSIVLTSHSMEECEALCTRLAIMVNGKFRCLGSCQHLKNKFGDGYTLIAQIETNRESVTRESLERGRRHSSLPGDEQKWEQDLMALRNFIEGNFPGCILKDVHPGYVHYHIPSQGVTWGGLFRKMEEAKQLFRFEAYSVGQTSLEQIFLSFTKGQFVGSDNK